MTTVSNTLLLLQAVFNWQRQSTVGWSIGTVTLDYIGSFLNVGQMFLQGWNVDNFSGILGGCSTSEKREKLRKEKEMRE